MNVKQVIYEFAKRSSEAVGNGVNVVLVGVYDPGDAAEAYFLNEATEEQYPFRSMPAPNIKTSDMAGQKLHDEDEEIFASVDEQMQPYLDRTGLRGFYTRAEADAPAYCKSRGWVYEGLDTTDTYPCSKYAITFA